MKAAAVFLDRDGTIIEDVGYLRDEKDVRLLPGAAEGIRRLSGLGYLVVVVSNQSGIARGLLSEADLSRVQHRMKALLEAQGAHLDGAYYCPYLNGPEAKVDAYRCNSSLRKPAPGMILQAARELSIDLSRSWMIGNADCDVEAGVRAGCRTILLRHGPGQDEKKEKEDDGGGSPAARGRTAGQTDSSGDASHASAAKSGDDKVMAPTYSVGSLLEATEILESEMKPFGNEPSEPTPPSEPDRTAELLQRIHDQLARANRQQRQHDFSVLRLFGALLQMLALVTAVWGAVALFGDASAAATARLALACFLQLASISAFATDRFR